MAFINTGLGWGADDQYLLESSGSMGGLRQISGPAFTNQPIGIGKTALDIKLNGIRVTTNPIQDWYYASDNPANEVLVFAYGNLQVVSVSASPGATVNEAYANPPAYDPVLARAVELSSQDPVTGLYYYEDGYSGWSAADIPTFASLREGLDAISVSNNPIYKLNQGYAVAAYVRWRDFAPATYWTPMLISTLESAVTLSTNGTDPSPYAAKNSVLYNGVYFYVSYLRGIDGGPYGPVPAFDANAEFIGPGGDSLSLQNVFDLVASSEHANILIYVAPDPYEQESDGASEEEGGEGEETESDENGIEVHSTYPSAIDTGFCRIYSPSKSQLQALSNYLWSNSYDLNMVKKLFTNPMDSILGLSAVPIQLLGSSVSFSIGGVPVPNMTLPLVTQQFYTYSMGAITVKERWGSYLDYEPYTKFSIVLPFIGIHDLSADDIMGKQLILYYDIDILSGTCIARIQAGKECLYEFSGTCAVQLPVNSRNWDSVFNNAVSAVKGIVTAASGGSAPLVAGSIASAALQTVSMKPRVEKSGSISGAAGWMGQLRPYLIRTTPEAYIPKDQNTFIGYPSYINVDLASLGGYNEVESIHLEGVPATGDELAELERILKEGVIF